MAAENEDSTVMMGPGGGLPSGPAVLPPPKAKMVCLDDSLLDPSQKGLVIQLDGEDEKTLGRGDDSTFPIRYSKVSRHHAKLFPAEGKWGIKDLNSTNGVWVNDVRVDQARLSNGDYVKIGAIPFRFIIDRPDAVLGAAAAVATASGDIDEEHTMMFSDARAADVLMAAEEQAEEEEAKVAEAAPARKGAASGPAGAAPAARSGSKLPMILVIVLLLLGGGGFAAYKFLGKPDPEEAVRPVRKELKKFLYEHEEPTGTVSHADLQGALTAIGRMDDMLAGVAANFPNSVVIQDLQARLLFLRAERELMLLVESGRAERGAPMLAAARGRVSGMAAATDGQRSDAEKAQEMLQLAEAVSQLLLFQQNYPQPSPSALRKPSASEMVAYHDARQAFTNLKKQSQVNATLRVDYPFFYRVVDELDEQDLPLLDQWREYVE